MKMQLEMAHYIQEFDQGWAKKWISQNEKTKNEKTKNTPKNRKKSEKTKKRLRADFLLVYSTFRQYFNAIAADEQCEKGRNSNLEVLTNISAV